MFNRELGDGRMRCTSRWFKSDSQTAVAAWFACAIILVFGSNQGARCEETKLPPFTAIRQTVEEHFASQRGRQSRDIISRSEVEAALRQVSQLGWKIEDEAEIINNTLADDHVLIKTFRTPSGRRFMQQIASRPLMYDRFDRIANESGGPQMIRDLVKLPDGERYAKPESGGGVPDLLDLLPKNASGKTRRIQDYHKPTGHLYTVDDLLRRLEESHRRTLQPSGTPAKRDRRQP